MGSYESALRDDAYGDVAQSAGAFDDRPRAAAAGPSASSPSASSPSASSPSASSPSANGQQKRVRKYLDGDSNSSSCSERVDRALGFDAIDSRALVSSCFVSAPALLCVRACMWLYAVCITGWYVYGQSGGPHPARMWHALASLTGATLLLLVGYLTGAVVLSARHVCEHLERGSLAESAWLRLTFVLFEFAFTWALVAVALFWMVEWPVTRLNRAEVLALVHLHGVCLAFASLDLWLSRVKFEFAHYCAAALSALLVTGAYTAGFGAGSTAHTALTVHSAARNWHSFFSFLWLFAVLLAVVVSFVLVVGCTSCRDLCHAYNAAHNPDVVLPHGHDTASVSCAASISGVEHTEPEAAEHDSLLAAADPHSAHHRV